CCVSRRPDPSTLCPYTTLCRSLPSIEAFEERYEGEWCSWREYADHLLEEGGLLEGVSDEVRRYIDYDQWARDLLMDYTVEHSERSEEHTSELQSRFDLVCRRLL